jgi:hypothetical protein
MTTTDGQEQCCDATANYCPGFPVYRRQLWKDVQGKWTGPVRLTQKTCRGNTKESGTLSFTVKPNGPFEDPQTGGSLLAKTSNYTYWGYVFPADGGLPKIRFYTSDRPNGSCVNRNRIEMPNYQGGRTSAVKAIFEIECRDEFDFPDIQCRVVYSGRARRAKSNFR